MKYSILILLAALAFPFAARSQAVVLKTDTVSISCSSSDTFLMPVRVRNFTGVGSMQFTLSWTPTQLKYAYVTPGANNPFYVGGATAGFDTTNFISQGKLTFTWTKVGGATFPDNTPVFYVAFRRLGGPYSPVTFVNTPVGIEVTNALGDELQVQLMPGGVMPIDTIPPTITCPLSVTVQSSGPAVVNGINPTSVADNCTVQQVGWSVSGATTGNFPTDPDASGAVFNFGSSTVVYKVTDVGNATATCSFSVTVEPNNSSDTLTIIAGGGNAGCGQSIAVPITALNFDSLGSLQFSIKWDTAVLKFDSVSIAGSALTLDANNFGTQVTANGFLSFSWTSNTPLIGTTIPNGSLLFRVHLSPKNGSNAMTQIGFGDIPTIREATSGVPPFDEIPAFYIPGQITVADNTPPTIVCPQNIAVQTMPGELTANVTGTAPTTLTDNCVGTVALAYAQSGTTVGTGTGNADGTYNAGTTTVIYTATDASGNTATCSFQVFVDAGKAVLLALDSVETDCAGSALQTIAVDLTVTNFTNLIGLQFSVEWDELSLSLDQITNIFPGLGLTPGSSAFIYADTAMGILRFLGGTTGTWPNIPDGGVLFTLNFTVKTPGALSPISFLAPFDAVNQSFQSVPVSTQNGGFKSTADLAGPTFTFCPKDTMVTAMLPTCMATINFQPLVTDDCSGVASLISPNHPGNTFDPGMTLVTYIATDSVGNTSQCSFQVVVEVVNQPKLKKCPPNLVQGYATATQCKVPVFWQQPEVTGLCDQSNLQIVSTFKPGDSFAVNDPRLVVFVATDTVSGNFDQCSWTVTVLDTIAPKLICPKDTTLLPNSFSCTAIVGNLSLVATDNCDNSVDVTSGAISFPKDTFAIGTTPVTVTATDDSGNFSTCLFKVKVVDNEAPFFICPKDTVVSTNPNSCTATATWITPQAFDNCDTTILAPIPDKQPGSTFQLGPTVVTYSSTDAQGNKASCSFTVTVKDTEFPKIDCPSDILVNLPAAKCDTMLNWQPAFPTDNCGIKSFGANVPQGTAFPAKTTLVTYTVEDNAGNTATCTFNITARDGVRPVLANCPKDTIVNSTDPCGAKVSWAPLTATDNCTPVPDLVWTASDTSGTIFSIATTGVQITVADASGNVDTCKFNVKVMSIIVPGFDSIPASQTLVGCEAIATWKPPVPKGFCIPPTVTFSHMPGDIFKIGPPTLVTYTATDGNGTTYTATFSITVSETIPPVLTGCPPDSIVVNTAGEILLGAGPFVTSVGAGPNCSGAVLNFLPPAATDNCGLAILQQTTGQVSGSLLPPGNSVITFQAADASANTAACSVKVTVLAVSLPEVMLDAELGCPGDTLMLVLSPAIPGATYVWTGPQGGNFPSNDTIFVKDLNQSNIGQYKVVVSLGNCATTSDSTTVTLAQKADAVDDFTLTIDPGETDTFDLFANDVIPNLADVGLTFSPLSGLQELTPGSGKFIFTAGQVGGKFSFVYTICSKTCPGSALCDMATVTITVRETDCTFVPNIITPNGDTENDVFVIPCLEFSNLFRSNSIVIYNQWGDKVFEASPYQNNWGGTLDNEPGKDLPDGTYFYIFRPGPNEAVLKGFVEIYR